MAFAPSQASGAPIVPGRWFDRVIIFMFENHAYDEVIKNPDFEKYAKQGTFSYSLQILSSPITA